MFCRSLKGNRNELLELMGHMRFIWIELFLDCVFILLRNSLKGKQAERRDLIGFLKLSYSILYSHRENSHISQEQTQPQLFLIQLIHVI